MTVMFEIYYRAPEDLNREARLSAEIVKLGGQITYKEKSDNPSSNAICLTCEFPDRQMAERARDVIRSVGEHVEEISDYGP